MESARVPFMTRNNNRRHTLTDIVLGPCASDVTWTTEALLLEKRYIRLVVCACACFAVSTAGLLFGCYVLAPPTSATSLTAMCTRLACFCIISPSTCDDDASTYLLRSVYILYMGILDCRNNQLSRREVDILWVSDTALAAGNLVASVAFRRARLVALEIRDHVIIDESDLESLPDDGDGLTCCICLHPIAQESAPRVLGCGHVYHRRCLSVWHTRSSSCPLCRSPIDDEDAPDEGVLGAVLAACVPNDWGARTWSLACVFLMFGTLSVVVLCISPPQATYMFEPFDSEPG